MLIQPTQKAARLISAVMCMNQSYVGDRVAPERRIRNGFPLIRPAVLSRGGWHENLSLF